MRLIALALVIAAGLPAGWTRVTEEKGKRYILDGCDTGIQGVETSAAKMEFDFGQDSQEYEVTDTTEVDDGFNVTIMVKDVSHLVQIRYKDRKKGLAEFSSEWGEFRGAGLYVSNDQKKKFKVVKEKNCGN